MTGLAFFTTSVSKFASVTTLVAPTVGAPSALSGWVEADEVWAGSGLVVRLVREPPLDVDRGGTSRSGRSHRLAVGVVHHVTAGEHTIHAGPGRRVLDLQVTLAVRRQLAGEQLAPRVVADGHEHAVHLEGLFLAGLGVPQQQPSDLTLAEDLGHLAVPAESDLRVGEGTVLHDLGGPQLVPPVHHGH